VAVVIPAYNAGRHIGRALDSVLAQTRPAEEIIVVDDGSTDDTAKVVRTYGEKVRYIRQENTGAAGARNRGIKETKAEWIAFLDADDEWLPDKLELQLTHLQRNNDLVWTCGNFYQCWCNEERRQLAREPGLLEQALGDKEISESYFSAYVSGVYAWTSTVMVKRKILEEAGLFQVGQLRGQDADLWFRIAYRWPRIGYVRAPLAIYHRGVANSITKTYAHSRIIGDLVKRHLRLSAECGQLDKFRPCGSQMIQVLIREILAEGRMDEIMELVGRFASILPFRFKAEMCLRVKCPRLAPFCLGVSGRVKIFWRFIGGFFKKA